ncbi:MAG: PmoA family protein [Armatimonadetes bacterium]|nr:PmoA family protein [Armatimonadota bacterium]
MIDLNDIRYPRVQMTDEYALLVTIGEEPFFTYRYSPELPKPYLYPVHGPSGAEVTQDGHPIDPESHRHHHSIWVGHRDVNGVNFWEENDKEAGQIFHMNFSGLEETPGGVRIVAENHWLSTRTGLLLEETRDVVVPPATPNLRVIDMRLTFRGGAREITLGQSPFGFLGCRVAPSMAARNGGRIVNAQGGVNEAGTLGKRAAWMEYEGEARPGDWEIVGVVDEEANPRHPTPWHSRDDGWFGPSFTRDAPYVLRPNEALTLHYLMIFRTKEADETHAQALSKDMNELYAMVTGNTDELDDSNLPSLEEILKQMEGPKE